MAPPSPGQHQAAPPQNDHQGQNAAPAAAGGAASGGASRKARQVGGVQGYDAQQQALRPDGGPQAGPLTPAKAQRALRYNKKREGRQGAAWVADLQGLVGAAPTGAYDDATSQAVAAWQGGQSLRVDGEVGPKTERKAARSLPPAPRTERNVAKAPAAAPEASPKPEANPDGASGTSSASPGGGSAKATPPPGAATPVAADPKQAPAVSVDAVSGAAPGAAKAEDGPNKAGGPDAQGDEGAAQGPGLAQALTALAGLAPPVFTGKPDEVDLSPLGAWTAQAATVLSQATTVYGSPGLTEAERNQLGAMMASQTALYAAVLKTAFSAVRATAIKLVNESSALKAGSKPPTLPAQATTAALNGALRKLDRVAQAGVMGPAAAAFLDASHTGQDALLAIAQGRSVLAARETWKKGIKEPSADKAAAHRKKKDDPLNAVFADAGWSRYGVSTTTTKSGKKKVADWCGMFVGAHMFRGGGLDQELRAGFLHTTNVLDYFQYQQKANAARAPKSVWADGSWQDLKTYHGGRGSLRTWTTRATITSAMEAKSPLDIRPGDVVLIDHKGNKPAPQHITMVESYDPATQTLVTIEGNTGGIQAPDGKGKAADGTEWYKNHHGPDGSGIHRRDLTTMSAKSQTAWADVHKTKDDAYKATKTKAGDAAASKKKGSKSKAAARKRAERDVYKDKKGATVFGVGRPSIVDFEEHEYASHAVPSAYQKMAPAEIRALAKKKGKKSKAARVGVLKPR